EQLEEIVVTALGIQTEKKKLNFAVQSVNSDALTDGKSQNFVNALQGKIAGLSVTNSSGSPNSGTQIIIRGISSVNNSQNNEPLFVLDGMPLAGKGSAAADINPNDIENVTVLKGAAASALYGQDAANGVIMITTKRGEAGKISVTANTSFQYDAPTRLVELQNSYAPGSQGFYRDKTMGGWGPLLNPNEQTYNNVENFLKNGFYQKYDVSLTGGSEKFQTYASANYSKNDGIVPNDFLNRMGVMVKGTFQPTKSLSLTLSANISETTSRSFGSTGMSSVYSWPINDDITNYQLTNGYPRFLYYNDVNKYNSPISPLYSRYNDDGKSKRTRNIINGAINWKPIKNLELTGRLSYDVSNSTSRSYSVPRWDDSYVLPFKSMPGELGETATATEIEAYEKALAEYFHFVDQHQNTPYLSSKDIEDMDKDALGSFYSSAGRSQLFVASAMATYKIELPKEFSIDLLAGAEMKKEESFSTSNQGRDFIIPGTYSLSNTNPAYLYLGDRTSGTREVNRAGAFGEIRGDYKGLASLSVSGRWDWSSTIIYNPYFYPSVTAGLLFSELFNISNDFFSYGKLRGNYALVGKDAPPYLYDRRYKQFQTYPDNGYGIDPTLASADRNLTPELSYSMEIGADLRFFNSKTRLDIAYYSVQVDNQIVTVRVSPASGYILQVRNEGNIRNQGVELSLEQDIVKNRDFSWVGLFNFGLNRGKVVGLPEDVAEITGSQYGDIFTSAYLGESTTALSGKDYLRTEDGKIIVDANGLPQIGSDKNKLIGNREPLFSAGLTNTLRYKDLSLSFLFNGRLGGDVANITGRGLISNGQNKILETYRGRQVVVDGVVEQPDGSYLPNTTPITLDHDKITNSFAAVSSNFIEDGSYLKLSYVTLGYDLSKLVKGTSLNALRCTFTANNLFMLTRYTGADPTLNANTGAGGTGSAGIDNYAVPNTTSFNFSISATF
ncbi:MAG: SusC/RagA family TonB-linked outer membrane protein, partial [Paludibacteraceae bacterium]